jgi:hypothetical protein
MNPPERESRSVAVLYTGAMQDRVQMRELPNGTKVRVTLTGERPSSKDFAPCPVCGKEIRVTKRGRMVAHDKGPTAGDRCAGSGQKRERE